MFNGFSQQTSDFLWGLTFNNERSWFLEHKNEFEEHLMMPFKALADDVFDVVQARHGNMGMNMHISRIYRDARRLHGRGPYKDHLWFSIKNWDGLLCGPMFWFEIGAADCGYGMGFYSATAAQMEQFRRGVDANPARLERLAKRLNGQSEFFLEGPEYKRPKGDAGELLNPWYNRKWLGLCCRMDFGEELFDASLVKRITDGYEFLMPYYDYFMGICEPEE